MILTDLTDLQFHKISRLIYEICGINLKEGKEALVRSRLLKRLRALGVSNFSDYLALLESKDAKLEIPHLVDVITTNKTGFFREDDHFSFLQTEILPQIRDNRVRFWSAACSSGEEPYTMAMVLKDSLMDIERRDVRILATDISSRMIEKARKGIYTADAVGDVPQSYLGRNFLRVRMGGAICYQALESVRSLIAFARLNLMEPWPMKGPFDIIFCRNVMIYFDRVTQEKLVNRFWELLTPGGYLFVGHSEGLSGVSHPFRHVRPAIYRK